MYRLWIYIIATSLYCSDAGRRTTSKLNYDVIVGDDPKDCENFQNNIVDMSGLRVQPDGSLSGTMNVSKTLGSDGTIEILIEAFKDGNAVRDFAGMVSGNICQYLKNKHAPWNPIFAAMKIEDCPIEAKTYVIANMKFNSDYADDGILTHEMTWYPLRFSDTIKDCENFNNKAVDFSELFLQNDTLTSTSVSGTLIFRETLGQNGILEILITVYKEEITGQQIVYILSANLCEHMNDEYAPWAPFLNAMGTHSCPIEAGTYSINNLKLNMEYAKSVMKHELVGEYLSSFQLLTQKSSDGLLELGEPQKPLSCHTMTLSIFETKEAQNNE